ncbi:UBA-e1-C domain-containing protein [Mycena chlorophos]|uniref:UBA-e1-C domain-containing protein n=1 Tax=Mycena chlorophos TaxID=658473 RepID=A0A8H6TMT5_MYCCL|nr:UBA-e1-C domain-containing protein [Mycena chlorophos]
MSYGLTDFSSPFALTANSTPGSQAELDSLYVGNLIPLHVVLAALTWVLHDYCITVEDEIRYIWPQRLNVMKLLFLWIRYYTFALSVAHYPHALILFCRIVLLLFDAIQIHVFAIPNITSDGLCVAMDTIIRVVGAASLWSIEIIMQLRVYALYNRSKRVAAINLALFLISIAAFLWILVYNHAHRAAVIADAIHLPLPGCPTVHSGIEWAQWVPATIFEGKRDIVKGYRALLPLHTILLRDNILYFFGVCVLLIFNNLMTVNVTHIPWFSYGPFHAAVGIMTARMLINLRKAASKERELDMGFIGSGPAASVAIGGWAGAGGMAAICASSALVVGLDGLGAEVAKNLCLAGFKSLTMVDSTVVSIEDLGSQFLLRENDVGMHTRAGASAPRLRELMPDVEVRVLPALTQDALAQADVVVLCNAPISQQIQVDKSARDAGVHFVAVETRGLFGRLFVDFGDRYTYLPSTREDVKEGRIISVEDGIIRCPRELPHGLGDGDFVVFSGLDGPIGDHLHGDSPLRVSVVDRFAFKVDGFVSQAGESYVSEDAKGMFRSVLEQKTITFKSLEECLAAAAPPLFVANEDPAARRRASNLHQAFDCIHRFRDLNDGALPRVRNAADAAAVLQLAPALGTEDGQHITRELAFQARGSVPPFNALLGALAAHQAIAACTKVMTPLHNGQLWYLDALDCLPRELPTEEQCQPRASRYDCQIAVFGRSFVEDKVKRSRQLLVGAGSIGTEILRNWALMGVGAGRDGDALHLVDSDFVQRHNLPTGGGLFGRSAIESTKVHIASRAVESINPDLKGKLRIWNAPFAHPDDGIDTFRHFHKVDVLTSAVDNIKTRLVLDAQCIVNLRPLIDVGMEGTKGHVQVVIPHHSESYASQTDYRGPEDVGFVHKNPYKIDHAFLWADNMLADLFVHPARRVNQYLTSSAEEFFLHMKTTFSAESEIEVIQSHLAEDRRPTTFADCVQWARTLFEQLFVEEPAHIGQVIPAEAMTPEMKRYWTWPRVFPTSVVFNSETSVHKQFVFAAATLRAMNYHIEPETELLHTLHVPTPLDPSRRGSAETPSDSDPEHMLRRLIAALPPRSSLPENFYMVPIDVDPEAAPATSSTILEFLQAATNLRAAGYSIKPVADRRIIRRLLHNNVPKLVTTAAVAGALACLELYKARHILIRFLLSLIPETIVDKKPTLTSHQNTYFNLALPLLAFSAPAKPKITRYGKHEWTLWDRFVFTDRKMTLATFIAWFMENHQLHVGMVSYGVTMVWSNFLSAEKSEARLNMHFKELIETVTRKPLSAETVQLVVEVMVEDETGEDVEVPFCVIHI